MTKLTLDMATFKALASDTRLDILKALDGKRMALKDICKATKLNKATLHEHLSKLNEAGLVKKKEREGHKWVFYKLTWKGECLLHPENTRIVVLFSVTFLTLCMGIVNFVSYVKGQIVGYVPVLDQTPGQLVEEFARNADMKGALGNSISKNDLKLGITSEGSGVIADGYLLDGVTNGGDNVLSYGAEVPQNVGFIIWYDPSFQYIAIACIVIFSVLICISFWRLKKSRTQKF